MPLELDFHQQMVHLYERARDEAGYNATRFLRMLGELGGLQTAKILLHEPNVSDGYTALWEKRRLDLTVEALVLEEPWNQLFSFGELEIARSRLRQYGYTPG